ncbi:MAG: M20/M25/M40 family metallo-hydrolase [Armatimonadetes bacterium]|nr:M20/M25/M40 family metallo-hydrolase [Anaerolineae bacterium]
MRTLVKPSFYVLVWFSLVSLACNLGAAEAPPPTLQARVTAQAVATLGFFTPVPGAPATAVPVAAQSTSVATTTLYTLLGQVDEDRLMFHIRTLQDFHTRHVNSVGKTDGTGISAAYDYLNGEFTKIQTASNGRFINLSPHEFTMSYNGITSDQRNVVGYIQGTESGAPMIVVGAHYDSRTNELTDATSAGPGADDNGSGVAAVVEMARILSQYPPRSTVLFALFSGEEEGRYGSIAFVRDYIQPQGFNVSVMLNLDTIGSVNDSKGNINDREIRLFADPNHPASRYMAQAITFIADNNGTDLSVLLQDSVDREGRFGDHLSFSGVDFPAVRFIEALEDTPKREGLDFIEYVEADYLEKSTRTILSILVSLAGGLRPPDARNIVVRDNGNGTQRLVWEPVPNAIGYVVALRVPGDREFGTFFTASGQGTAYEYDGFTSARYEALAIAAIAPDGIMGPLSQEYRLP